MIVLGHVVGLRWETNHLRDTFVRLILLPSSLLPYFHSSSSSLCSFAVNQIHGAFPHTEFFIFSLLSFENALIRIYEMKAEVCLRLRLVCPIVSLPLSLSLHLLLSFFPPLSLYLLRFVWHLSLFYDRAFLRLLRFVTDRLI